MLRRPDPTKKKLPPSGASAGGGGNGGGPSNAHFLHEIEALSKALARDPKARRLSLPSDPKARPEPEPKPKPKPASIWSWKPLKALSHLRHPRRFDCTFSLLVHSIEGLPPALSSSAFVVHWRRASESSGARTRPAKAFHGSAEFEEVLTCRCSVYGSCGGGGSRGAAKYEPRDFLVYVTLAGATGFDFGKHRVELTGILPVTMEELEGEKSLGEWSTSFRLAGKARGATLNVSFGYRVGAEDGGDRNREGLRRVGSVRGVSFSGQERPRIVAKPLVEVIKPELEVDLKPEYEVFDELSESPELKCCTSVEPVRLSEENECDESEFTVIEKGVEIDSREGIGELRLEKPELESVNQGDEVVCHEPEGTLLPTDTLPRDLDLEKESEGLESPVIEFEKNRLSDLGLVKDLDLEKELEGFESPIIEFEKIRLNDSGLANHNLPIIELEEFEHPRIEFEQIRSNYKSRGMKSKSLSLDAVIETVAGEFLNMLGLESTSGSDPESPREQLWKQFQQESLNADDSIFGPDIICSDMSEDFDLSSMIHAAEMEQEKQCVAMNGKSRAKMLEDAETESLMREWGLDKKVFESSQPGSWSGFGSPIHLPPEEPLELPPLGENLGSVIQTKDGGFLRSMSPSLFKGSKICGNLVMQASNPVVVPAEMGSDILEILQGLASVGIEKLSMQASKLMPLEDVTGKTMQQVAWEADPSLESCERMDMLQHVNFELETTAGLNGSGRTRKGKSLKLESSRNVDVGSEFVSLENLAPLAMDKIEALSIEGLRIQSGMSDEEAPSNISPQFIGDISALEGKGPKNSMSLGLEGAAGLQLLDVKDSGGDVDGLMGLSITLDEWMRLDSGVVNVEDEISERTTKVLAAHHAKSTDFLRADKRGGKSSGKRWGLLGNNFTVALMVQLRDPLRNYEPVGTPMLALIQVERVFVPPKPKIYSTVSERGNSEQDDEPDIKAELATREEKKVEEDVIPQFKITEVHVAGLKTESCKRKLWGNPVQQQSGSRWLLANGMGKSKKHPFMKANAATKPSQATTKVQPGDTLWSISSRVHGSGAKWEELAALNPQIRNPNVIFPNETIRLC